MANLTKTLLILAMLMKFGISSPANAQSSDERFHDLFVTTGYTTALGAALGAAALTFKTHPENHLRFVAVGASLGFIGGTAVGSYMIFSPVVWNDNSQKPESLALVDIPAHKIVVRPYFSAQTHQINALEAAWNVVRF